MLAFEAQEPIYRRKPLADPHFVELKPAARMDFPENEFVRTAAISPDGQQIYVAASSSQFNAWSMAVSLWPEILGSVTGITVLVFAWRAMRVRGRPQRVGHLYCRRCNYEVGISGKSPATERCSECGVTLASRVPIEGRSSVRRLRLVIPITALVVLGYAALWVASVPRYGPLNRALWWPSAVLRDWSESRWPLGNTPTWWLKHRASRTRILKLTRELTETHELLQLPGSIAAPSLSPDGRYLLVVADHERQVGGTLTIIDLASPNSSQFFNIPGTYSTDTYDGVSAAGFSGTSDRAFVAGVIGQDSALFEIELSTGQVRVVLREPMPPRPPFPTDVRRYLLSADGTSGISVPNFGSAYAGLTDDVVRFTTIPPISRTTLPVKMRKRGSFPSPKLSPDGLTLYWPNRSTEGIQAYDAQTGELLWTTDSGTGTLGDRLDLNPTGNLLSVGVVGGTDLHHVWIRDLILGRWIGSLDIGTYNLDPRVVYSRDDRWAAVVSFNSQTNSNAKQQYPHRLQLFDLSLLPLDSTNPPVPSPTQPSSNPSPPAK